MWSILQHKHNNKLSCKLKLNLVDQDMFRKPTESTLKTKLWMQWWIQNGVGVGVDVPGVGIPLFWIINAFEWGHKVGTPPLLKMTGSAPGMGDFVQ